MKSMLVKSQSGQALILIVLTTIALIAITGLAVDGGIAYSTRRQAQNAADAASLAGSLARIQDIENGLPLVYANNSMRSAAFSRAADNGFNNNGTTNTVEVHSPPISGYYSDCANSAFDCNDYVQVIIATYSRTYFAVIVGTTQIDSQVQAAALAKGPSKESPFSGSALVTLKPTSNDCSGDFVVGGSGTVTLEGGGIFVNSNNEVCAFVQDGCDVVLDINGGTIATVGGMALNNNCLENIIEANLLEGAEPVKFPPDGDPKPPPECGITPPAPTNIAGVSSTIYPGSYSVLPPNSATEDLVIMTPGNYCVSKVLKTVTSAKKLNGNGVFIYIEPGGDFNLQGGDMTLSAPTSGDYKGLLIFVDTDYSGVPENCTIAGAATNVFTGTIYAPYCSVTINGGSSPVGFHSQIISYDLTLNGDNSLTFYYDPDALWERFVPSKLGLVK